LLLLSIISDGQTRQGIEHELDLRRLLQLALELDGRYFPGQEMPTGGRFAQPESR
jgi:hypothetical protein